MQIAVLGAPQSWHVLDLARAAGTRHRITPVGFRRLASYIHPTHMSVTAGDVSLDDYQAVIVRSMPLGSLEQVVFRMNALACLEAAGVRIVNPPRALEASVDKYLALAKLRQAGLPVPETMACQTLDEALTAFETLGGDVVVKPLFGGEGRGITRINDAALARRAMTMLIQLGAVIYLQRFIPHAGCDWRLFVVGGRVLGMERRNPHDWRTNVSRGATTRPLSVDEELERMATMAAHSVGAVVAGVDVLPGLDGQRYVLEVNAVPGWRALSTLHAIDVAGLVLAQTSATAEHCPPTPATAPR